MALTVGELVAYLGLDDSKFKRGLNENESRYRGFGNRINRMSGAIGRVALGAAVGGVAAIGGGLIAGAVAGMKFNSSIEQTTIAMGTMLGSTAKAKALIGEVTKMAAATPFEFPELADATKRLVAYGVAAKDAVPLMTRLGDISSALNIPVGEIADLYGKMKVSGRIAMDDINQMAGRGIPIYKALADVLGVSQDKVRGLVEEGKVGFPDVEKAFQNMTDKGSMFGGMMEKQSKSFAGQWSTLKDAVVQTFADAIKPGFTWLTKTAMPAVNDAMPSIQRTVKSVMGHIGKMFGYARDLVKWWRELSPETKKTIAVFGGVAAAMVPILAIGVKLTPVFGAIMGAVTTLAPMVSALWAAFQVGGSSALLGGIGAALGPIGWIALAIGGVIAALVLLWKNSETVRDFLIDAFDAVREAIGKAWSFLKKTFAPTFKEIAKTGRYYLRLLAGFWKEHGAQIRSVLKFMWDVVKVIFGIIVGVIEGALTLISGIVRTVMALIRGDWSAAWKGIQQILKGAGQILVTIVKELGKLLGAILKAAWAAILSQAKSAWNGIAGWLGGKWRSIRDTAAGAFNGIKTVVGGVWDWVKSKTSGAWSSVLSTVGGFVNRIISIINVLPGVDVKKVSWGGSSGGGSRGDSSTQGGGLRKGDPSGGWDALLGTGPGMGGKDDSAGHGGGFGIPGLSMPTAPKLPGILANFLPELVKTVWAKIKKMMADIFASANTGGPGYSWAQALARKFGLTVTSTYRPGAITAAGYPSDHGIYGRAADIAGPAGMMGNLWRYIKSTARSWKQAIYGHEILNNGRLGHYAPSDHFDHVHVARNYSPGGRGGGRGDDSRLPDYGSRTERRDEQRPLYYLDLRGAVFGDTRAGAVKVFEMAQRGSQIATPRKGALSAT